MEDLLKTFNEYCENKYKVLKDESSTYGELEDKIYSFKTDIAWNKNLKEDKELLNAISNKMIEIYKKDISERTIDFYVINIQIDSKKVNEVIKKISDKKRIGI